MTIDTKQISSVAEANQNFSESARFVDEYKEVIVSKNNSLDLELTDDEKIDIVAARIMKRFKSAFIELAK